ncbi:MAG: carboxymuconolactone decarboxylase family protein [Chloroflexota bacterium]
MANPSLKPWIRWLFNEEATGLLKKEYDTALQRAGRIWNIVRIMSLRPPAMQASMRLYGSVVHRTSPMLGRAEREMIAVVVSQINQCHY